MQHGLHHSRRGGENVELGGGEYIPVFNYIRRQRENASLNYTAIIRRVKNT